MGVHSASEDGEETDTSLAVTTLMARVAAEMEIPPAIIGKMVATKAASVEWLTHADLLSMNVTISITMRPRRRDRQACPLAFT